MDGDVSVFDLSIDVVWWFWLILTTLIWFYEFQFSHCLLEEAEAHSAADSVNNACV